MSGRSRVLYARHIEIEKPVLDIWLPIAPVQKLATMCTCINLLARPSIGNTYHLHEL